MADYARLALDAGARIIGGCCGTTPEHLRRCGRRWMAMRGGERPDVAQVVAAIGPLASPPARADATPRRAGRRRG